MSVLFSRAHPEEALALPRHTEEDLHNPHRSCRSNLARSEMPNQDHEHPERIDYSLELPAHPVLRTDLLPYLLPFLVGTIRPLAHLLVRKI